MIRTLDSSFTPTFPLNTGTVDITYDLTGPNNTLTTQLVYTVVAGIVLVLKHICIGIDEIAGVGTVQATAFVTRGGAGIFIAEAHCPNPPVFPFGYTNWYNQTLDFILRPTQTLSLRIANFGTGAPRTAYLRVVADSIQFPTPAYL